MAADAKNGVANVGDSGAASDVLPPPTSVIEARSRARLLHETIHGTLQVVHRDFFDEDDAHAIPSASLEDVFHELATHYNIELQWLIIDTDVVNVDHQAEDEFEKSAVKAIAKKQAYYEAVEADRYRFAGAIRLASQCLKCHVKHRTSTEDRTAGLLIAMPIRLTNPALLNETN
ncbi:signal peptide protein [Rhodopirellula maiorica SM1]|uniref:Signal peptide protein n=2 Tax=Novipirellula TaxID=2795426 RepID=M5RKM2_9BACT|nr:signal peptide protein [Rhodopirellula maiorica SM1]